MALVGDLGSVDLAQVFQVLAQNQKDGVLEIYRGNDHRGLRFRRGTVTLQFDRDVYEERAIELLTALGRVSEEKLQLAASNRTGSEAALLEVLIDMKILSEEEIVSLFRERMAEELYDLFSWSDARFEFHEGASRLDIASGEIDDRLCFPSDAVVMEAARRLDEWSRIRSIIPDDEEVYVPAVDELKPEDDLQAALFVEADGARSASGIFKRVGRSRFEVTKALARLVEIGALAPLAPEEYPARGEAALAAGRPREAANLFDRAVASGVDLPASIGHAAAAWEALGERAVAAERYTSYGDALLAIHDREGAIECYRKANELVPTNLDAWKKHVLLALELEGLDNGERPELHPRRTRAHELADVFLELGQTQMSIEVLERVAVQHPKDLEIKKALIAALEGSGSSQRLAELLESVAEEMALRGDTIGAAASLQRVLRLQPNRKELSARIRDLYKSDERKRSTFKLAWVLGLSAVLLAAVAFLAYSREERARADLAALDVASAIDAGDFDRARLVLREFQDSHPLTFVLREAAQMLATVDAAAAVAREKEANRRATESAARQRRQEEATSLAAQADRDARAGNLPAALAGLRKALAAAPPDWEQGPDVLRNANDLESYLTGATKLAVRISDRLAAQDFTEAREAIRELMTKYPRSPEGTLARYPVQVKSDPPGAQVEVMGSVVKGSNGEPLRTPATLMLAPLKKPYAITVKLDGHEPRDVTLDPSANGAIDVKLGRSASAVLALPGVHSGSLLLDSGRVFVGLAGGRVAGLNLTGDLLWNVALSAGGEVNVAPVTLDGLVYFTTSDGAVAALVKETGQVAWKVEMASAIRVPLLPTPEGLVVAPDDGRLRLLDRMTAERRREWRIGAKPSGVLALDGNRLFVGCADGRVRILDFSNPKSEDRSIAFASPVSHLTIFGDTLLVSGDDGRLTAFHLAHDKLLWDLPGRNIAALRPVVAGGKFIADRDGHLVALDVKTGVTLASSPDFPSPAVAFDANADGLTAVLRDGTAVTLDLGTFAQAWQWPGPVELRNAPAKDRSVSPTAAVVLRGNHALVAIGRSLYRFDLGPAGPVGSAPSKGGGSESSTPRTPADSRNR